MDNRLAQQGNGNCSLRTAEDFYTVTVSYHSTTGYSISNSDKSWLLLLVPKVQKTLLKQTVGHWKTVDLLLVVETDCKFLWMNWPALWNHKIHDTSVHFQHKENATKGMYSNERSTYSSGNGIGWSRLERQDLQSEYSDLKQHHNLIRQRTSNRSSD